EGWRYRHFSRPQSSSASAIRDGFLRRQLVCQHFIGNARYKAVAQSSLRLLSDVADERLPTAPVPQPVFNRFMDALGPLLQERPLPCKQTAAGWVNAATGAPLALHPTHWQHHVETSPTYGHGRAGCPSPNGEPYDRSVDMLVVRLRRKIEPDPKAPRFILSVQGVGYKFDVRPQSAANGEAIDPEQFNRSRRD